MWPKGTLPSPPDPAHDLLRTPGRGCLNEACKKIENTSLEGWERSYALVEYMCTLAHAHFVHVAQDHRRRLSKRLLVHPRSYCKMLACKRTYACFNMFFTRKSPHTVVNEGSCKFLFERFAGKTGSWWIQRRAGATELQGRNLNIPDNGTDY